MFDASNRDQCEIKRTQTNTPLQALIMLNDPTVTEAARVLSEKIASEQKPATQQVADAFRIIVCRKPSEKELKVLQNYYDEQLKEFNNKTLDAAETLNTGEYKHDKNMDTNATAALMKVILAVYNLEETITKT
jgi:hypothetical protein